MSLRRKALELHFMAAITKSLPDHGGEITLETKLQESDFTVKTPVGDFPGKAGDYIVTFETGAKYPVSKKILDDIEAILAGD